MADAVGDPAHSLCTLLDMVRTGAAATRPELMAASGFGRKLVAQRVGELIDAGLLAEGELGPSTGGRAPRRLRFHGDAGRLLVAELGSTSLSVGLADLTGRLLAQQEEPADVIAGPEGPLGRIEELFAKLLAEQPSGAPPLWGIGVGVLGPVDAATGRPVPLTKMPGWGDHPVRKRFVDRFDVPVWVDNEVNLMALGEYRGGRGRGVDELLFLKIGTGIGAGFISGGRLRRGAQGSAGEIGHVRVVDDDDLVCWCGATGCLLQKAGGHAIADAAARLAASGASGFLSRRRDERGALEASDVAEAAADGDVACVSLLSEAGRYIGRALAAAVNLTNPGLILIGGGVANSGDVLLAAIREAVYRSAFPSATRDLRVEFSPLSDVAGLVGAAHMVLDELFSVQLLTRWIETGSPRGLAEMIHG